MTRRTFIKFTSGLLFFLSFPLRAFARRYSDEAILEGLTDALIPSGNTPGAKDIGLHKKMLTMIRRDNEKKAVYLKGFDVVREAIGSGKGQPDWVKVAQGIERTRFFRVLRRDAMKMFYSDPASWSAIGYDGPPLAGYTDYPACDQNPGKQGSGGR